MRAALALVLALAGCTAPTLRDRAGDEEREMAKVLADRTPGPPRRCIGLSSTQGPMIVGTSLIYRDGGRLWRNDPVDGCPSLRGDPVVITESYGGEICANDRFRTLPRQISIPGPYCRFGAFTPWVRKP